MSKRGCNKMYDICDNIYRISSNCDNVYAIIVTCSNNGWIYYLLCDVIGTSNNEINEYINEMRRCNKDDFLSVDFRILSLDESVNHCFNGYLGKISFENLRYLNQQVRKTKFYQKM